MVVTVTSVDSKSIAKMNGIKRFEYGYINGAGIENMRLSRLIDMYRYVAYTTRLQSHIGLTCGLEPGQSTSHGLTLCLERRLGKHSLVCQLTR